MAKKSKKSGPGLKKKGSKQKKMADVAELDEADIVGMSAALASKKKSAEQNSSSKAQPSLASSTTKSTTSSSAISFGGLPNLAPNQAQFDGIFNANQAQFDGIFNAKNANSLSLNRQSEEPEEEIVIPETHFDVGYNGAEMTLKLLKMRLDQVRMRKGWMRQRDLNSLAEQFLFRHKLSRAATRKLEANSGNTMFKPSNAQLQQFENELVSFVERKVENKPLLKQNFSDTRVLDRKAAKEHFEKKRNVPLNLLQRARKNTTFEMKLKKVKKKNAKKSTKY